MFRRLIGLLLIAGCSLHGSAQQRDHFIYIQSDNKQPFNVKVGSSTSALNSSSSGYLILPKIPMGRVSIVIGFPDNAYPGQHFICNIPGDRDKGYLLKRFPDKGWALYDLQELTIIYAGGGGDSTQRGDSTQGAGSPPPASSGSTPAAPASGATTVPVTPPPVAPPDPIAATVPDSTPAPAKASTEGNDAFGDILVAVTNDPSLKNLKTAPKTPPAPAKGAVNTAPARHVPDSAAIILVSTQTTGNGVQRVYTDRQASGNVDTVQVLLPVTDQAQAPAADTARATPDQTAQTAAAPVAAPAPVAPVQTDTARVVLTPGTLTGSSDMTVRDTAEAFNPAALVKTDKNKDTTSNYIVPVFKQGASQAPGPGGTGNLSGSGAPAGQGVQTAQDSQGTVLATGFGVQPAPAATGTLANTDCKRIAGDEDFLRLRKKLAADNDVDRMIEVAHKAFKKTCFTTEQIKQLSFLFLQEDGRYKFLEEAYPFTSDSGNFKTLQGLFSSVYFVNRFKALVQR